MTTSMDQSLVLAMAVVPFALGVLTALLVGHVDTRLAPATAAVLLTCLALTVALGTGLLLCLASVISLAEAPFMSGLHHWSPSALRSILPARPAVWAVAGATAVPLVASTAVHLVRVVRQARRASVVAASLPSLGGDLTVLEDDAAIAYALPGRHHRIVVSTGMLKHLSPPQRRVLLAHEASHLRHHHHRYVQLGRLAAAANPLLRPVSSAIDLAVERWADESAVREVGDRRTVARALAAAALASAAPQPHAGLGGARSDVGRRVELLLRPPAQQLLPRVLVSATIVVCWVTTLVAIGHIHGLMELAES